MERVEQIMIGMTPEAFAAENVRQGLAADLESETERLRPIFEAARQEQLAQAARRLAGATLKAMLAELPEPTFRQTMAAKYAALCAGGSPLAMAVRLGWVRFH
jgi:TorA maturation chaperone TorD